MDGRYHDPSNSETAQNRPEQAQCCPHPAPGSINLETMITKLNSPVGKGCFRLELAEAKG
jgi:hypothetical protein